MTAVDGRTRPEPQFLFRAHWARELIAADLAPGIKLLGLILATYVDDTGAQGVWFTTSDFARLSSLHSLDTVSRYRAELERGGWIRRGAGNEEAAWFITWPAGRGADPFAVIPHHHATQQGPGADEPG